MFSEILNTKERQWIRRKISCDNITREFSEEKIVEKNTRTAAKLKTASLRYVINVDGVWSQEHNKQSYILDLTVERRRKTGSYSKSTSEDVCKKIS